jgi:hypothetical protein
MPSQRLFAQVRNTLTHIFMAALSVVTAWAAPNTRCCMHSEAAAAMAQGCMCGVVLDQQGRL